MMMIINRLIAPCLIGVALCIGFGSCKADGNKSVPDGDEPQTECSFGESFEIQFKDDAFANFLRSLPRKDKYKTIKNYEGKSANLDWYKYCVIDFPLLSPVEQCADVCMHLRAEFLFRQKQYDKIHFLDINGRDNPYKGGASHQALEKYLRRVYEISNTASMYKELVTVPSLSDIRPGDMFIYPAKGNHLGHVVMVCEVAKDKNGDIYYQVLQGYTPACEPHIMRNNCYKENIPWFKLDTKADVVEINLFKFGKGQLKRWR